MTETNPDRRGDIAESTANVPDPTTLLPEAIELRDLEPVPSSGLKFGHKFDARPDRVDTRDFVYQPGLGRLRDKLVNCREVPEILDQGTEGACTGFALAAVINFLLNARGLSDRRVSPRMLYEMARRYDEWPGEGYSGSSARGAMKGWVRHGVCRDGTWPKDRFGVEHFTGDIAHEARETPGGAFYRVSHRDIRDMHAALSEVGILYATLMVHDGWSSPGPRSRLIQYQDPSGNDLSLDLPVIERGGRADAGHAIAIVGYTDEGFIIQNSWGTQWGANGFALLPYEDYMLHATDVWVAQLGVPVVPDLWSDGVTDTAGIHRASPAIPLNEIRPYIVDVGNNGELSSSGDYWTTAEDLERLFTEHIPRITRDWPKKRVLLYLHGGLNDERSAARRVLAYRDVLLKNQIYPVHIMWETGFVETLNNIIKDFFTGIDPRAGDWLSRFRDGLIDARDRSLELTVARPGEVLWSQMKENARLASQHPRELGAVQLLATYAKSALDQLDEGARQDWELHVVGHSAGCIFTAHALEHLTGLGVPVKTVQLMAPAITIEEFNKYFPAVIDGGGCPLPTLYILSDTGELADEVGPYGKSLLYLVSNAFEGQWQKPLLGMQTFLTDDETTGRLFAGEVGGLSSVVVAGAGGPPGARSASNTHGGFDNDPETLNSVLFRILGRAPDREFTTRDLQF